MIERTFLEQLAAELRTAVEGTFVERVGGDALRVLVPNPRWAHDWVAVTIEARGDGVVLSDAGELRSLAGDDTESFVELLNCAGAELELVGDVATITIDDPDDTARAVLSLAHYVIAAPVLWHARRCLADEGRDQQEPSAVRELAKATKQRLTSRFGDSVGTVIRLNASIKDRGERAIAPMVMARQSGARPMLISTFVDYEATQAAVSNAKRTSEWVYAVARDLHVPKFIVARASDADVSHLGDFYDHLNVTALSFDHTVVLEESVGEIAQELGLPVG